MITGGKLQKVHFYCNCWPENRSLFLVIHYNYAVCYCEQCSWYTIQKVHYFLLLLLTLKIVVCFWLSLKLCSVFNNVLDNILSTSSWVLYHRMQEDISRVAIYTVPWTRRPFLSLIFLPDRASELRSSWVNQSPGPIPPVRLARHKDKKPGQNSRDWGLNMICALFITIHVIDSWLGQKILLIWGFFSSLSFCKISGDICYNIGGKI